MRHKTGTLPDIIIKDRKAYYKETKTPYEYSPNKVKVNQTEKITGTYKGLPAVKCSEGRLHIPLILGAFGALFLIPAILIITNNTEYLTITVNGRRLDETEMARLINIAPFVLIGAASIIVSVVLLFKTLAFNIFGKKYEGTIAGYTEEALSKVRHPMYMLIKIWTDEGGKIILYQTHLYAEKRPEGEKVTIKVFGDMAKIIS